MRLRAPRVTVVLLAVAGCGADDLPPPAEACTAAPEGIVKAVGAAPRPVVLPDGSRLQECIERAMSDADLQTVGATFSSAAELLRERMRAGATSDGVAASRGLGYLVGATRKGGSQTNGVLLELVRRIESTAGRALEDVGREGLTAFKAGERAGEASG
jgi:hypothetical protein